MPSSKNKNTEAPRKLTIQDLAFGIGRKVTDEEWELHLKDTEESDKLEGYTIEESLMLIKKEMQKRKAALKKSLAAI
ncbi:MAG: hypothetical protein RJA25_1301 [Bacteroidota bacterium]|jgi:hypothetical protein